MNDEEQIRTLMRAGLGEAPQNSRTRQALGRVRRVVGQKDSIGFALVRIWAVLARLLAPLFALVVERQARAEFDVAAARRRQSGMTTQDSTQGENHD